MKKALGFMVFVFIILNANAQLLWKVTGNGLSEPSYIFGTHHLAPISIIDSIPGFDQAFESCAQVIGEVVMADMMNPETMRNMQKYMFMGNDTTLKMLMTPDEYDMVYKYAKENLMVDISVAEKLKPALLSNSIMMLMGMKAIPDFNPQMQLDGYLQQKGIEQNKNIDGFETLDFQFNLLFNSQSLQRQTELLICSVNDTDKLLEYLVEITNLYMARDLDGIYRFCLLQNGNKCDPLPIEMENVGENRNINWAEAFPEKVKNGSAFIVVGALHLPGDKGILNLFKNKGYSVEAVN